MVHGSISNFKFQIIPCPGASLIHGLARGGLPGVYAATPRGCLFYDLLYRPELTPFLRQARAAQRPIVDGRRMLLHQGALAFSLWTRTPAPLDTMAQALKRTLRNQ